MQIGEHLAAIACWLVAGTIGAAQATASEGVANRPVLKRLYVVGILALCVLMVAITVARKGVEPWTNLAKLLPHPCSVSVAVKDQILDRVHTRARWLPDGHTTELYKPVFRDLFHDFIVTITPSKMTSNVVVTIQDARKPADVLHVDPPNIATVTGPRPSSVSGFEEPTQAPDFWIRTVKFAALDKPATITIRKPIKGKIGENVITNLDLDLDLDRTLRVTAGDTCKVVTTPVPPVSDRLKQLVDHIKALIAQKLTGPVMTRPDPDQPYPPLAVNESESVLELRCKDPACVQVDMTPYEKTRIQ
jgi:hypothetical protein